MSDIDWPDIDFGDPITPGMVDFPDPSGDGTDFDWDAWLQDVTSGDTDTGLPPSDELMDEIKNDPGFSEWLNNLGQDQGGDFWDDLLKGAGGAVKGMGSNFLKTISTPRGLIDVGTLLYSANRSGKNQKANQAYLQQLMQQDDPFKEYRKEYVQEMRDFHKNRDQNLGMQANTKALQGLMDMEGLVTSGKGFTW